MEKLQSAAISDTTVGEAAHSSRFDGEMDTVPFAGSAADSDLWIFREGQRQSSGPELLHRLSRRIAQIRTNVDVTDALIDSGQIESALADAGHPGALAAAELTDALALGLCGGTLDALALCRLAAAITAPELIRTSPPEGFTYYALHPIDFAHLISRFRDEPKACAVIGIRSIGTTLSAVVAAALKMQARPVSRITVRPTGHPYARVMTFSENEIGWMRKQISEGSQFLVVDEGPGRSGSTFLALAEALIDVGVPRKKITLIGSREVDPGSLLAKQASLRWNNFRFVATVPSVNRRFEDCRYAGGGDWRQWLLSNTYGWSERDWPESWTQMERLKFLARDGSVMFKFEGMGPLGAETRERARILADSGFSPSAADTGDGFLAYSVAQGRTLRPGDLSSGLLEHIARYCAFRTANFPAKCDRPHELRQMLEHNVRQEFGVELDLPEDFCAAQDLVLADGRMQPHEWISGNRVLKTDAVDHGDNHFFPGPCDVAWDLAGTAVEWHLTPDAVQHLATKFENLSGIDVSRRLPDYLLAYSVFRLGFCKMAISAATGPDEDRLRAAYRRYRALARQFLEAMTGNVERLSAA